jgi:hypothetical protein
MQESPLKEPPVFVELNRRFGKLGETTKAEHAALLSYTSLFLGKDESLGWEDLLKQHRVVILSEPGSRYRHLCLWNH